MQLTSGKKLIRTQLHHSILLSCCCNRLLKMTLTSPYVLQTNVCVTIDWNILCTVFIKIENNVKNLKIMVFTFFQHEQKYRKTEINSYLKFWCILSHRLRSKIRKKDNEEKYRIQHSSSRCKKKNYH